MNNNNNKRETTTIFIVCKSMRDESQTEPWADDETCRCGYSPIDFPGAAARRYYTLRCRFAHTPHRRQLRAFSGYRKKHEIYSHLLFV